jgi:hypothetical protein
MRKVESLAKQMIHWYKSLADVPGVDYGPSPGVNRSTLPGYNVVPKLHTFEFEGNRHESLEWPTPSGTTSASPASQWTTKPREGESPSQTALRRMREALELPGQTSDYHFAIQGCGEMLWKNRSEESWVIQELERLYWLDIRLIEAHPETISFEREGKQSYFQVAAFNRLVYLYKREGYLHEALIVARRAVKFDQQQGTLEELQQRIAALELEDANSHPIS